jgi:phosphatidate cytidylyltransferase
MTLEKSAPDADPKAGGSGPAPQTPMAAKGPSNLVVRFLSAIVLGPLFLAVVWVGDWVFTLTIVMASVLCYREWLAISAKGAHNGVLWAGHIGLLAAGMLAAGGSVAQAIGMILLSLVLVLIAGLLRTPAGKAMDGGFSESRKAALWVAGGLLYAGLPLIALLALRLGEQGLWAVAIVLAVTWATDIAAYFAGRAIGGPKLWPAVSPKKTWSGALGGLAGAIVAGIAVVHFSGVGSIMAMVPVFAALSVLSQLGDLGESAVKRHFGVKDSGTLIPGHGGIMDRIDGLVAAALGAFAIGLAASGGGDPSLGLSGL